MENIEEVSKNVVKPELSNIYGEGKRSGEIEELKGTRISRYTTYFKVNH